MSDIHEECGVFGIFCPDRNDVARSVYYGLFSLQHRGQESCGIVVNDDGLFTSYKDLGLVNDVFTEERIRSLGPGNMAIGHVRYGTTGATDRANAQPMVVNHIKGPMALAHNGNLTNAFELRHALELNGSIFHTTSDTEVISYIITDERLTCGSIEESVAKAMEHIKGAYSIIVMSPAKMIAARDPNGFRPLCYGQRADGSYVIASESCALDAVGARLIRDIDPGEVVVFTKEGVRSLPGLCDKAPHRLCVFEYLYFARPDSVIEGCGVHDARIMAGRFLARSHPIEADIVVGVPDSGIDAALGYSQESGIPYEVGFIKNKYIGRTFISPGQSSREDKVRIKLNPIASVMKGRRVILVDDSIVRGTTSARIVRLVREAGAKEVHLLSSAPPFISPCYYGVDIDSKENLIACQHTIPEIAEIVGADSLGYLSVEDVRRIACDDPSVGYCTACFDGDYPVAVPKDTRKSRFEQHISDTKKG